MKNLIFTVCCLAIVSGCQPHEGSQTHNVTGVADVSQATGYEAEQPVPEPDQAGYQEYQEQRFGSSCEVERDADGTFLSVGSRPTFDSSLKVGDTAYVFTSLNVQKGSTKSQRRMTIREISKDKVVNEMSLLSMSYLDLKEILAKPLVESQDCEISSGPEIVSCTDNKKDLEAMKEFFTSDGYNLIKKNPDVNLAECSISNPTSTTSQISKGTYQIEGEEKIPAYQEIQETKGVVECQGFEVGEGTVVSVAVSSLKVNAFPSDFTGASGCGGTVIFRSTVAKVGDQVLSSSRFELKPQK
jgi:hypothetical protein